MLGLKLLLVPTFLALVSWAGKKWGPEVAGWLAGFPIVTGPILLLLALDKGSIFTAHAASLSLSATCASVAFSLTYSWSCLHRGWFSSLVAALGVWAAVACLLIALAPPTTASLAIALVTLLIAPFLFPRLVTSGMITSSMPKQELLIRMGAGAALTLLVTAMSSAIGPAWSGMLAVFPIIGIVLAVFSQRINGAVFAVRLLKSMASGLYSFVTFCFTLATLLKEQTLMIAFSAALLAALIIQGLVKAIRMRV